MPIDSSIFHNVDLIPQPTQVTCWAASTAMLTGTTVANVVAKTPSSLLTSSGGLRNYSSSGDWVKGTIAYANIHGLKFAPPMSWTVEALHDQLKDGPIMFDMLWNASDYAAGAGSPGHVVLLIGMSSDDSGVTVTYNDPWPPNVGARTETHYNAWVANVPTLTYRTFWR